MIQYFNKKLNRSVEVIQLFDSHLNYLDPNETGRVIRQGLPEDFILLAPEQPPILPENWGKPQEEVVVVPQEVKEVIEEVKIEPIINFNTATIADITQKLPGIGKVAAKKIVERRPKTGYENFLQVVFVNKDLNLDNEAWEKIKPLVEF